MIWHSWCQCLPHRKESKYMWQWKKWDSHKKKAKIIHGTYSIIQCNIRKKVSPSKTLPEEGMQREPYNCPNHKWKWSLTKENIEQCRPASSPVSPGKRGRPGPGCSRGCPTGCRCASSKPVVPGCPAASAPRPFRMPSWPPLFKTITFHLSHFSSITPIDGNNSWSYSATTPFHYHRYVIMCWCISHYW